MGACGSTRSRVGKGVVAHWLRPLLWCTHTWLWEQAASLCVVAGYGCKHTSSGAVLGRQQAPEPTIDILATVGALAVSIHYHGLGLAMSTKQGGLLMGTGLRACKPTAGEASFS